jgi:hypothetical protein
MDTLKNAFTKSRSASFTSSQLSPSKSCDSASEGHAKSGKATIQKGSLSSKQDRGIGRIVVSSRPSANGLVHSRNTSTSSPSIDYSVTSNGSLNG